MEQVPLVSAIIAAYNREAYLSDAIESIMNQTYRNLEIISCTAIRPSCPVLLSA
ncbi:MAG: glycosyltransferase [Acidobacteriota bacterium]